ncbi:hypothetical protein SAMN05421812_11519 [Asanoa hainanensis]|uniref:Uncharacterized protein n=1 Tax=Asanoa hainanensis TaxID=560556 RepID=A0A239P8Z9_9ACTN|nr:hypothetical protein SAMN05421812_11519 [Asanoa hainanensis]
MWGTFSVRDHVKPEAFLRELLVFDRLVIPYPDPHTPGEWLRWRRPDPSHPRVSWNPGRLDQILGVLGTEEESGYNGARLAQRSMWNPYTWQLIKSNADIAAQASGDPYHATALGIRAGTAKPGELPDVVEAVAAYRTEKAWRQETKPTAERVPAMEALIQVPRPLMLPPKDGNRMDKLRAAVDLSLSEDFRAARRAYFTWFRDFITPLRSDDPDRVRAALDAASIAVARQRLRELWAHEIAIAKQVDKSRWGSRFEFGCMSAGALGGIGLAVVGALPGIGVSVAVLSFGGWAAKRFTTPKPARSLSGASMFVAAQRRLGWLEPGA